MLIQVGKPLFKSVKSSLENILHISLQIIFMHNWYSWQYNRKSMYLYIILLIVLWLGCSIILFMDFKDASIFFNIPWFVKLY